MQSPAIPRTSSEASFSTGSTIHSGQPTPTGTPPPPPPPYIPSNSNCSSREGFTNVEPIPIEELHVDIPAWEKATHNTSSPPHEHPAPPQQPDKSPCALLHEHPALWQVKNTDVKLSTLAARILTQISLITPQYLSRIPINSQIYEGGPTDPITGITAAAFETVTDVLLGVANGPLEAYYCIQATKHPSPQSCPLSMRGPNQQNPYDKVAMGTIRGVGKIVGAGIKAPVLVTTAASQGFGNVPKLYGDEVRAVERVEGVVGGVKQAGKGLGLGLYDGLTGFVMKPYDGAKKDGPLGFFKGVGKGIGGVICKPAAGAVGVAAYPLLGLWREAEKLRETKKEDHLDRDSESLLPWNMNYDERRFVNQEVERVLTGWQDLRDKKNI